MHTDDWQLLREYATHHSEDAFRALVDRYGGFVYHTALRRLRRPQLAQDVTQAVFIALARKASRIPREATLSGWLYRATQFAVTAAVREAIRRERREQEISMQSTDHPAEQPGVVWEEMRPHLDDALGTLSSRDREAVLLRFFHNHSHADLAPPIACLAITAVGCVSANKVSIHDEPRVPVRFESAEAMQTFYDALLAKALPTRNKPSRIHVGQTVYTAETRDSANAAFNHAVRFSDRDSDGTISLPEARRFALASTDGAH